MKNQNPISVKFTYPATIYVSDKIFAELNFGQLSIGDTFECREIINGEKFKVKIEGFQYLNNRLILTKL